MYERPLWVANGRLGLYTNVFTFRLEVIRTTSSNIDTFVRMNSHLR